MSLLPSLIPYSPRKSCLVKGLIWLLALIFLGCQYPQALNNLPTELHQKIPGTRISLIPPAGFKLSRSFVGFSHRESKSTIKVEYFDGPFTFWDSIGIDQRYINKYWDPIAKEKAKVNGLDGWWTESSMTDSREGTARMYALYFGDGHSTMIVSATCAPPASESLAKALKTALQTVVYDPNDDLDMEEAMPFGISLDSDSFYLRRATSQSLVYSEEVVSEEDAQDSSTIEIIAFRVLVPLENRKDFARDEDYDLPEFRDIEVASLPMIELDSLEAFPYIITGVDRFSGDSAKVYQLWLFSDEGYYLFKAKTKGHFEKNLKLFQEIGATFDRK